MNSRSGRLSAAMSGLSLGRRKGSNPSLGGGSSAGGGGGGSSGGGGGYSGGGSMQGFGSAPPQTRPGSGRLSKKLPTFGRSSGYQGSDSPAWNN